MAVKNVKAYFNPLFSSLNSKTQSFLTRKKKKYPTSEYLAGIRAGDRVMWGRAITLIESTRPDHQEEARHLVEACLPFSGKSIRIGVTGSPGVGKSTFIESFGQQLLEKGHKLGILAIDPSSQRTGGSILGDKTRMEKLSTSEHVFIRPSPAGGSLGGVARKTRETIILCEAAGSDIILIETVGVGQSETLVHSMVDFFLLLLLPGAGDELQGIKRGIVEMADLIAVNKADGDRKGLAKKARTAYKNALHLFPPKENGWIPQVISTSGLHGEHIHEVWIAIQDYVKQVRANGFFEQNRKRQASQWFHDSIDHLLRESFFSRPEIQNELEKLEKMVLEGKLSSFGAAEALLKLLD